MSTLTSQVAQGNGADIVVSNLVLASAAPFDLVIPAQAGGLFVAVDTILFFSFPANHGGIKINWKVPLRLDTAAWPLAKLRDDWTAYDEGSDEPGRRLLVPGVADPIHTDAVIIPPGSAARIVRLAASHLFRSPAAGATISLQACKVTSAASPTLLAFSAIEARMFT